MEKGPLQLGPPVVFAPQAGFDLWYRSLKVGDWSHRALPITAPPLPLTSDTAGLSSVTALASISMQSADTDPVLIDRDLFLSRFIDLLNNLSLLIFPDKLFPLLLTFPVTARPEFCLHALWHCGLWRCDIFSSWKRCFRITVVNSIACKWHQYDSFYSSCEQYRSKCLNVFFTIAVNPGNVWYIYKGNRLLTILYKNASFCVFRYRF